MNEVLALEIEDLENKIDELIQLCDELEHKYKVLQSDQETWLTERSSLMQKNKLAKNKVEAMIMRLKALGEE
ncbi:MAG: TIGR02449 family protein [Gammaproteobacteria bacterium]|uniref:TIGR02449 family protein n=1 Tax=OM182 bacterium TaxID=2510334 RepID=A0A520S5F5_9GAMM|nr:TIGR02449 family protein [Gammaproteobacteria bacterium]OUV68663.1 MAG: TIGR02449 family protein [Gammaproteobacteria bacterium TMED133]RZO77664.1 MAG: TIGR02449 family protein [OM182 bacterium]